MKQYGLSYMGSKSKIAEWIIDLLPAGRRFVDLFGGGFAMSHCALESGKFPQVFYNEINPLLVPLIRDAINGKYSPDVFKPEWISREKFFELKEKDGYIKYIWSFGNNGNSYIFGKDIENFKRALHNAMVFDDDKELKGLYPNFLGFENKDYKSRRIQWFKFVLENTDKIKRNNHFYLASGKSCEQLQRLQRLQRLERLQRLQRLELHTGSYLDYEYKEGDVVYCDPPYEDTQKYCKDGFNHKEFYDWVASRPYPVFFSSYDISDNRFYVVDKKEKRSLLCATNNSKKVMEKVYCNMPVHYIKQKQLELF